MSCDRRRHHPGGMLRARSGPRHIHWRSLTTPGQSVLHLHRYAHTHNSDWPSLRARLDTLRPTDKQTNRQTDNYLTTHRLAHAPFNCFKPLLSRSHTWEQNLRQNNKNNTRILLNYDQSNVLFARIIVSCILLGAFSFLSTCIRDPASIWDRSNIKPVSNWRRVSNTSWKEQKST